MSDRPRATAGVLLHRQGGGAPEVAVVHRPRYDDWTWPKGGVKAGEHRLETAVREVAEETGLAVVLGRRLPTTRYARPGGTTEVSWWTATVAGSATGTAGGSTAGWTRDSTGGPDDEVDRLRWVTAAEAQTLLSYPGDRECLADWGKRRPADRTVVLVRHADAGDRRAWKGPDAGRPLDPAGHRRAERLASILTAFCPSRVVTASPRRCAETIEPLAGALGVPVEIDPRWDDESWRDGHRHVLRALEEVAASGAVPGRAGVPGAPAATIVCSQGETIPGVVSALARGNATKAARADVRRSSNGSGSHRLARSRKGSFWVLSFSAGELIAADYTAD